MSIYQAIEQLIAYAKARAWIADGDEIYAKNRLFATLGITEDGEAQPLPTAATLADILAVLLDTAAKNGKIDGESITERDLLDTEIMGILLPRPSEVTRAFFADYEKSPALATDNFYRFAIDANYIRADRIAKDMKWTAPSRYGEMDITVNLSKPEKDPHAIAAAKNAPVSGYPACLLCHENVGFAGNLQRPARQNLRQIPITIDGADWYLQYSPYVYYNEHCIALSAEHTPMTVNRSSFRKMLDFVKIFPHYFIGQNADLPIVGGSILAHDHMQGGRYVFAMENAPIEIPIPFADRRITGGIVKWPMSVIRLTSKSDDALVELADRILTLWRGYTDADADIYAETDGEPHNTVTPIARRRGKLYELDLVLRNNRTTAEHPLGIFHPHAEHHNIKKENIGLIEVMGLAVLPARLKAEMEQMKTAILAGQDFAALPDIAKHKAWFDAFRDKYAFTTENTEEILKAEIGATFVRVLEDAGVYKSTPEGRAAFLNFVAEI